MLGKLVAERVAFEIKRNAWNPREAFTESGEARQQGERRGIEWPSILHTGFPILKHSMVATTNGRKERGPS